MTNAERRIVSALITRHEDTIASLELNLQVLQKVLTEFIRELGPDEENFRQGGLASVARTLADNIPTLRLEVSQARASLGLVRT
jgi:hypothetical protein